MRKRHLRLLDAEQQVPPGDPQLRRPAPAQLLLRRGAPVRAELARRRAPAAAAPPAAVGTRRVPFTITVTAAVLFHNRK